MIIENNANDLYRKIIKEVNDNFDYEVAPRGKPIREKIGMQFRLTNPRDCLITLSNRKLNYRFAIIEKMEYLYGKHSSARLVAYNRNMSNFVGDYGYFDGNYAQRFNFWLEHVYSILRKDPDSRQAVVSIYDSTARHQSLDVPCTLTLQLFIRNNRLHLMVNMRSNDLLWGLPYDMNAFCFLQEVLASWLNLEMGEYIQTNGSTHIYLEPKENYEQLISCIDNKANFEIINPRFDLTYEETQKFLPIFFAAEEAIRTSPDTDEWRVLEDQLPVCLQEYFKILATKWISNLK